LLILVTDTGNCIPAARLGELFKPFNRLDAENGDIEGTGIGLTITRRIVELMGGVVDVVSEEGVGSTFWIELPIDTMHEYTSDAQEGLEVDNTMPSPDFEEVQHTVLYIEDNPANLKLVTNILKRRKHIHLLTAQTAKQGIELATSRHPALILLDINMAGMDGYQVLEFFKSDAYLQNTPVIAVTANAMASDIEHGVAAGFTDYVTKPIDIARFNELIDKLLRQI